MNDTSPSLAFPSPLQFTRGIGAALAAVVVAYFAIYLLKKNGFYAMMLPGLLVGSACGYASGCRSQVLGIVSLLIAIVASVLLEWQIFYNEPLPRFLANFHTIGTLKIGMHLFGAVMAYWFGTGRLGELRR